MKTAGIISALAAFVSVVNAGCYSGGELWGDKATALSNARSACDGALQGTYGPSGTPSGYRGICLNGNGKKLEFQIWHIQGGDRQLGADECYDGLQKEINGCDHGGDTSYTNWRYK